MKLQCHSGADGVTGEPDKGDGSCNAVFPKLAHIPARNKDLVLTRSDTHGDPDLSSDHGVCAGKAGSADAYDWNSCWKVWDALRSCAYSGRDCRYALGDTREIERPLERWNAGRAVEDPGRRADPALSRTRGCQARPWGDPGFPAARHRPAQGRADRAPDRQ